MTTKITTTSADIAIIGGGSGGLSLAAGAAQLGARVVLFEGRRMGGDCLNNGCVPSKALLAAARAAHNAAGNPAMGITNSPPEIDFAAVKAYITEVMAAIAPHDSMERFEKLGVTVIPEMAAFAGPHDLVSINHQVKAKFIVIATGSRPFIPPITGLDHISYHTNETIFTDTEKPLHLLVIGGGPIGVEMAQAHQRLGCKVTLIDASSLLPREDRTLVSLLKAQLVDAGITIIDGVRIAKITNKTATKDIANRIRISLANGTELTGSHLFVAAGRTPQLDGLNLQVAGINYENNGIITDSRLRTNKHHIFAIGDVTGRPQFTHNAGYHAGIVIQNCLFRLPAKVNDDLVPRVTYCDPELAHVGMDPIAAKTRYGVKNITILETSLSHNDRAVAERRTGGMVKVIAHKNGLILGASILAPGAGEMIFPWSLAISQKAKISSIAKLIFPYPTYSDSSKHIAGSFFSSKLFSQRTQRLVKFLLRFKSFDDV